MKSFVMKRFTFLAVCAIFSLMTVSAQWNVCNNPFNKTYFGIRASLDIAQPSTISDGDFNIKMFKPGAGFEFGGICNIPLVANLYLEPGLKLAYDTYSVKKSWLETEDVDGLSLRKFSFRIPVMVGYHFDFKPDLGLHIFMGPELDICASGKEYVKYNGSEISSSLYGDDSGFKRTNILFTGGIGLAVNHFWVSISNCQGMTNMLKDSDGESFYENRTSITVGYNF